MDASRVLLALEEQAKWRQRKTRLQQRLRQLQGRRRYFLRELEVTRNRIAEIRTLLEWLRGETPGSFDLRTSALPMADSYANLALLR